jgi:8-oxo-dGTP pyrophosphatase MutT (NUDIX family)
VTTWTRCRAGPRGSRRTRRACICASQRANATRPWRRSTPRCAPTAWCAPGATRPTPSSPRPGTPPLALIERASSRFWGTLTFGAHCNGWVAGADGRPARLWVARRAWTKATDPGKLDNLIGGGVPHGQSPFETLVREGHEEAGLDAATVRRAVPGSVIALACDIAEGFMHEHLHAFDLELAPDAAPVNQDGEVAELTLRPVDDALALAAAGEMTVDAALVTLDFALRHGLAGTAEAAALHAAMRPLRYAPP